MTKEFGTAWSQELEDEYNLSTGIDGIAYEEEEELIGADKPHHLARSLHHQPNHVRHIKSVPALATRLAEALKHHITRDGKK